ncbi:MAG TPA: bifunctional UDP-N-acetylglucosamine diphosphorylase/glucosamine-1-phosphate N-acetyltransferase GlmU [Polyangiaceae bacterium]|nr:bifunctional UDP-N-acetylglucosamine diphosphorylase/glucosamine-1-phosphate N-acetyltransferase GlmU [Polyangiaceae bacterium]
MRRTLAFSAGKCDFYGMSLTAVVLAAGLGTRMKSRLPKVLHPIAGRPLAHYAVRAAFAAGVEHVVVVTSGQPEIEQGLAREYGDKISCVKQDPPRGTGDAVRVGISEVKTERVLILCGDTPLVRAEELTELVAALDQPGASELSFLTCSLDNPSGYGRVLRDGAANVREIREQRDLKTAEEHAVREVNSGIYAGKTSSVRDAIGQIKPNNAQGEYYLTDIVALLARSSRVTTVSGHRDTLLGVNDRSQLGEAEEIMLARIRTRHAKNGVTVRGNARIDDTVEIGEDALIEDGVHLRGKTQVGSGTIVDTGCVLVDAIVGAGALLKPYTVITSSKVGDRAELGPFAHLRPDSELEAEVHVGNFVETKKTIMRRGSKANHLSYLGDGDIGERANIGAGTIFCNYDGFNKHKTTIGPGAFIGSDSHLVAPVTVGRDAYVGTGTTVTENVPDDALAISRVKQVNKPDYAPKLRARFAALKEAAKAEKKT